MYASTDKYPARELPIPTLPSLRHYRLTGKLKRSSADIWKKGRSAKQTRAKRTREYSQARRKNSIRPIEVTPRKELASYRDLGDNTPTKIATTRHTMLSNKDKQRKRSSPKERGGRTRRLHHAENGKSLHTKIKGPARPVKGLDRHLDCPHGRGRYKPLPRG